MCGNSPSTSLAQDSMISVAGGLRGAVNLSFVTKPSLLNTDIFAIH
jgi:hypothetical protein